MPATLSKPVSPKLSICITTFNRAAFIGTTLESILTQLTDACEIVVLDGGSTDNTQEVMSEYTRRSDRLRYIRQQTNSGFDRDIDSAVECAAGEYCWLTSDDDLLRPGAVAAVLEALHRQLSLVIVNVEFKDFTLSRLLQHRWLDLASDRTYSPGEMDSLFGDLGGRLLYVGGVVIRREIWLARERQKYFGSMFIYVAMIFQERLPGDTLVMAEPFITCRWGNTHTFSSRVVEIIWFIWPSFVWSLAPSDSAKWKVCSPEPWRSGRELLVWRALGRYSSAEYRKWIRPKVHSIPESLLPALVALLPGILANTLLLIFFAVTRRSFQGWRQPGLMLQSLRNSCFYFGNMRLLRRTSSL